MSLQHMPSTFLDNLIEYLSIYDVLNLSLACKNFYEIFGSNRVWEPIFIKYFGNHDLEHSKLRTISSSYKEVCLNICEHLRSTANDVGGEEYITEKMYSDIVRESLNSFINLNSSENSSQSNLLITENEPNLDPEIELESEINSKNFTINQDIENVYLQSDRKLVNDCSYVCKKQSICGPIEIRPGGVVSKKDLLRRLNILLQRTKKYFNPEDALPGDKTTKYALRFRNTSTVNYEQVNKTLIDARQLIASINYDN